VSWRAGNCGGHFDITSPVKRAYFEAGDQDGFANLIVHNADHVTIDGFASDGAPFDCGE
jgi:hypothetical protein